MRIGAASTLLDCLARQLCKHSPFSLAAVDAVALGLLMSCSARSAEWQQLPASRRCMKVHVFEKPRTDGDDGGGERG